MILLWLNDHFCGNTALVSMFPTLTGEEGERWKTTPNNLIHSINHIKETRPGMERVAPPYPSFLRGKHTMLVPSPPEPALTSISADPTTNLAQLFRPVWGMRRRVCQHHSYRPVDSRGGLPPATWESGGGRCRCRMVWGSLFHTILLNTSNSVWCNRNNSTVTSHTVLTLHSHTQTHTYI